MAETDEWLVVEDGCLLVGTPVQDITYHSTLNSILVSTAEPAVRVIDVTSGAVLQNSDLSANKSDYIKCAYLPGHDKVLFSDGKAVGVRHDLNGILLLDTALQTPIDKTEDEVKVELPLPEASHLFKSLITAELSGVDCVEEVIRELEKEIEIVQSATKANHKVAKWATVCLRLPHTALKTVCSSLVLELKKLHQDVPGLPVASAIADRLSYLLPSSQHGSCGGPVDRALMYSEAARRETFIKWPHMNYRWALPEAMSQAGFYHQPGSTGDDRAMCFTCNVCLVCWEPTDEPWSEHERHSPTCPFVKGEYTQNVPMEVTYATEPATFHDSSGSLQKIECISTTSCDDLFATSSIHGSVVVWDVSGQLKKHVQFNIDPLDPVINLKTGVHCLPHESHSLKKFEPKHAWIENKEKEQPLQEAVVNGPIQPQDDSRIVIQGKSSGTKTSDASKQNVIGQNEDDDGKVKSESVETIGPLKATPVPGSIIDIALDDIEPISQEEVSQRCRPSQDIIVSALCVLGGPKEELTPAQAAATPEASASVPEAVDKSTQIQPCLVSGVCIRRHSIVGFSDFKFCTESEEADSSEVQVLNQVNQALNTEAQIIPDDPSSASSDLSSVFDQPISAPFIPYLLVHGVTSAIRRREWKKEKACSGAKNLNLVSAVQDFMMPQIMEVDEDPDVQIVGYSPPNINNNTTPSMQDMPPAIPVSSKPVKHVLWDGVAGEENANCALPYYETSKNFEDMPKPEDCTREDNSKSIFKELSNLAMHKEGRVVQCIELPPQVSCDHYIVSVTPTPDNNYIVVITAPKMLHKRISSLSGLPVYGSSNVEATCSSMSDSTNERDAGSNKSSRHNSLNSQSNQYQNKGGCLLVYKVDKENSNMVMLHDKPVLTSVVENIEDTIMSILILPSDMAQTQVEDLEAHTDAIFASSARNVSAMGAVDVEAAATDSSNLDLSVAVTTYNGDVKILRLSDCKVLTTIPAPENDRFVAVAYCSGMDRLCASSDRGRLQFYMIGPKNSREQNDVNLDRMKGINSSKDDSDVIDGSVQLDDLLARQPLTTDTLAQLHELTQFENLMPRYSATVPSCWNEIQQEQQQRRHPQHLQQQGEAMQHTRTWRLQQDGTSFDEHLFELVLPKSCSVGHIDVKFSLHPLCTSAPNIQVTLLKQNISNIGRNSMNGIAADVDSAINFNITSDEGVTVEDFEPVLAESDIPQAASMSQPGGKVHGARAMPSPKAASAPPSGQNGSAKLSVINNVLSPEFLKRYAADVLCGPVELASYLDLSGHSGVITLSSAQLLKVRTRSFLVHIKALYDEKNDSTTKKKKVPTATLR